MNNQDYILKGVKLAGGYWTIRDDGVVSTPWWSMHMELHNRKWRQEELDALAAELVRQCDQKEKLVYSEVLTYQLSQESSDDRSMDTIKAVVDLGVLG